MNVEITAVEANEIIHAIGAAENEGLCDPEILTEFINSVGYLLDADMKATARELLGRKFLPLKPLGYNEQGSSCPPNPTP